MIHVAKFPTSTWCQEVIWAPGDNVIVTMSPYCKIILKMLWRASWTYLTSVTNKREHYLNEEIMSLIFMDRRWERDISDKVFSHGAIAPLKKGLRLIKSVIKTINYLICVLEVLKLELLYWPNTELSCAIRKPLLKRQHNSFSIIWTKNESVIKWKKALNVCKQWIPKELGVNDPRALLFSALDNMLRNLEP